MRDSIAEHFSVEPRTSLITSNNRTFSAATPEAELNLIAPPGTFHLLMRSHCGVRIHQTSRDAGDNFMDEFALFETGNCRILRPCNF